MFGDLRGPCLSAFQIYLDYSKSILRVATMNVEECKMGQGGSDLGTQHFLDLRSAKVSRCIPSRNLAMGPALLAPRPAPQSPPNSL